MGIFRADGGCGRGHGRTWLTLACGRCACHIGVVLTAKGCDAPVTNRIAIFLALFLIIAVAADVLMYGREHLIFLGKKLFELIEWMAFWR